MRYLSVFAVTAGFFLQSPCMNAQVFSFGLKGGINYSNIYGNYSLVNQNREGINAGAFANFNFTRIVGVISELNYVQKGFKYKHGTSLHSEYTEGEKRFDYLTVPILFKYQFGRNIKFYFTIGSYLGVLIYANDKGFHKDFSTTPETVIEWNDNICSETNDMDIGICFGAGLQYPVNHKFGLVLDGRYNSGLMLIEPDKIYIEEYRNVSINVNLGVVYHLAY